MKKQSHIGFLLCSPAILGLLLFYIFPFGLTLCRSFQLGMTGRFIGFENYTSLIQNSAFQLALKNTVIFWLCGFPLNLLLGLGLALLCEQVNSRKRKELLFLPALVPASCVALIISSFLPTPQGIGGVLQILGIYLWKSLGYTILILAAALYNIPKILLEEAQSAGANPWQIIVFIKLPLLFPAIGISLLADFINSFRVFRESYLLAGTHPDRFLYMVPHFLYNNFANLNFPRLAAASILILLVTIVLIVTVWIFVKWRNCSV